MENIIPIFGSLNDETRLRILALLLERDELCVCDIVSVLQLPQSTISRQLSLLKNVGWLKDRRVGLWSYYSINKTLSPIHQFLLPVLRNFLLVTEPAGKDIERLKNLRNGCDCV